MYIYTLIKKNLVIFLLKSYFYENKLKRVILEDFLYYTLDNKIIVQYLASIYFLAYLVLN